MAHYDFIDTDRLCPVCRGDMPLLSLRIVVRRERLHMTRAALARRLGVDAHTVARLERGGYRPQRRVLNSVLAWLALSDVKALHSPGRLNRKTGTGAS